MYHHQRFWVGKRSVNASDELEKMSKKKVKESVGTFGVLHKLAKLPAFTES